MVCLYSDIQWYVCIRTYKIEVSLKVACLPYAVGKQPSIPMINQGGNWMDVQMMMNTVVRLYSGIQSVSIQTHSIRLYS